MKKFALFVLAALLPIASATPQAMSYATPTQVLASGYITVGSASGFTGYKAGNLICTGINTLAGSYTTTQGTSSLAMNNFGISCAMSLSGTYDFLIGSNQSQPQNYFSYIRVVDTAGSVRIYTSASATYNTSGSFRSWRWGTGSSMVFTGTCTGGGGPGGNSCLMTIFR
jgi:hypothetical protein